MKLCSRCQTEAKDGAKFCANCGEKFETLKSAREVDINSPRCLHPRSAFDDEGVERCIVCGWEFPLNTEVVSEVRSRIGKILPWAVAAVVLIAAITGFVIYQKRQNSLVYHYSLILTYPAAQGSTSKSCVAASDYSDMTGGTNPTRITFSDHSGSVISTSTLNDVTDIKVSDGMCVVEVSLADGYFGDTNKSYQVQVGKRQPVTFEQPPLSPETQKSRFGSATFSIHLVDDPLPANWYPKGYTEYKTDQIAYRWLGSGEGKCRVGLYGCVGISVISHYGCNSELYGELNEQNAQGVQIGFTNDTTGTLAPMQPAQLIFDYTQSGITHFNIGKLNCY